MPIIGPITRTDVATGGATSARHASTLTAIYEPEYTMLHITGAGETGAGYQMRSSRSAPRWLAFCLMADFGATAATVRVYSGLVLQEGSWSDLSKCFPKGQPILVAPANALSTAPVLLELKNGIFVEVDTGTAGVHTLEGVLGFTGGLQ